MLHGTALGQIVQLPDNEDMKEGNPVLIKIDSVSFRQLFNCIQSLEMSNPDATLNHVHCQLTHALGMQNYIVSARFDLDFASEFQILQRARKTTREHIDATELPWHVLYGLFISFEWSLDTTGLKVTHIELDGSVWNTDLVEEYGR
jgi:hypothetical protein